MPTGALISASGFALGRQEGSRSGKCRQALRCVKLGPGNARQARIQEEALVGRRGRGWACRPPTRGGASFAGAGERLASLEWQLHEMPLIGPCRAGAEIRGWRTTQAVPPPSRPGARSSPRNTTPLPASRESTWSSGSPADRRYDLKSRASTPGQNFFLSLIFCLTEASSGCGEHTLIGFCYVERSPWTTTASCLLR